MIQMSRFCVKSLNTNTYIKLEIINLWDIPSSANFSEKKVLFNSNSLKRLSLFTIVSKYKTITLFNLVHAKWKKNARRENAKGIKQIKNGLNSLTQNVVPQNWSIVWFSMLTHLIGWWASPIISFQEYTTPYALRRFVDLFVSSHFSSSQIHTATTYNASEHTQDRRGSITSDVHKSLESAVHSAHYLKSSAGSYELWIRRKTISELPLDKNVLSGPLSFIVWSSVIPDPTVQRCTTVLYDMYDPPSLNVSCRIRACVPSESIRYRLSYVHSMPKCREPRRVKAHRIFETCAKCSSI